MDYIEDRLWLPQARVLALGTDDKIIHKGCGNRPSLFIRNDPDKFWCYCHRCRSSGFHTKANQRIKMKLPTKTGWVPEKMMPVMAAVVNEPYNFAEVFSKFNLGRYVSLLGFSPDTKRIYFPDESGCLMGLDVTGQAIARFYSPYKRNLCVHLPSNTGHKSLLITGVLTEYLDSVYQNNPAMLVMNREAAKPALATLSLVYENYASVYVGGGLNEHFKRDIQPFTG